MSERNWTDVDDIPPSPEFEYGDNRRVNEFFGAESPARFSVITFEPGQGGPHHYHRPPTEEYYLVLDGTLDITYDGEVIEAEAGTVIYTPPETPHQPQNNSEEPATLLSVNLPGDDLRIELVEE